MLNVTAAAFTFTDVVCRCYEWNKHATTNKIKILAQGFSFLFIHIFLKELIVDVHKLNKNFNFGA